MSKQTKYLAAVICGLIAAIVEFNSIDPQKPMVIIIVIAFPFGFFFPKQPWRWPVIIGLCFPLFNFSAFILGAEPQYFQVIQAEYPRIQYNIMRVLETSIALATAFLGTYAGVLTHRFLRKKSQ